MTTEIESYFVTLRAVEISTKVCDEYKSVSDASGVFFKSRIQKNEKEKEKK